MRLLKWIGSILIVSILLSGCNFFKNFSPDQVIENALASSEDAKIKYYAEISIKGSVLMEEGLFEEVSFKEWRDGSKSRQEISSEDDHIILVLDESTLISYSAKDNEAYEISFDNLSDIPFNPKEQLNQMLSLIRGTHDIEMLEKETFIGRNVIRLQATVREGERSLLGDMDLWIDDEHWIPLKVKTVSGELDMEVNYTKIDFNATFGEEIFEFDLPEGVKVERFDDTDDVIEITASDLPNLFEQPVLVIEESKSMQLKLIESMQFDDDAPFYMADIHYDFEGFPGLTLTITKNENSDEELEEKALELIDDFTEKVTIRGKDGLVLDYPELKMLSWKEDGLEYSVQMINPEIDLEVLLPLLEKMVEIK